MSKRILSTILTLALLCSLLPQMGLTAKALSYSGNCGGEGEGTNLTWHCDEATALLTIEGSGAMQNFSYETAPWYYNHISGVRFVDGLTNIGNWAFYRCSSIPSESYQAEASGCHK